MRVVWNISDELSVDDVVDHFAVFGEITDVDWLDVEPDHDVETLKLYFETSASVQKAMRKSKQTVRRADGKMIEVRACVKFDDNSKD